MPKITVDAETYELLRVTAADAGLTIPELVRRLLSELLGDTPPEPEPRDEVAVYAEYRGRRFEGTFTPATSELVVTSGELAGRAFATPSAAAGAVLRVVNPERTSRANGWLLWHVAATGEHLHVLRARDSRA